VPILTLDTVLGALFYMLF